jgi:hypothetical protein
MLSCCLKRQDRCDVVKLKAKDFQQKDIALFHVLIFRDAESSWNKVSRDGSAIANNATF